MWYVGKSLLLLCAVLSLGLGVSGCKKDSGGGSAAPAASSGSTTVSASTTTISCEAVSGTVWTPDITGASDLNHDASVVVYKDIYTASGLLTGLAQAPVGAHVITVSGIDMSVDLLAKGSISLVAEVTGFPSGLSGSAWPVLVSLSDGVHEFVNFDLAADCAAGFYTCPDGSCTRVAACAPDPEGTLGSAFLGDTSADRRYNWEQRQRIGTDDYLSVNSFPSCNWADGGCPFKTGSFFDETARLRAGPGVTYTAKYVLLTTSYSNVFDGYSAGLKLSVVRKKDSVAGGAIDINVILVGTKNISDSRTAKGQQNLNALFTHVYEHFFDNPSTIVKLGKITVYEWTCEAGGDLFSTINVDNIGALFSSGSALVSSASESKAVNVFLVSSIPGSTSGTILGISGGIVGSMINATTSSGVAFSTFDQLATFNPSCTPGSDCLTASQEASFIDMGGTISHEMGHFLGLNHLSESAGTAHDRLPDTLSCTTLGVGGTLTRTSCRSEEPCDSACVGTFCPEISECQFNHVMWWTSKSYDSSGNGDGNIFSTDSGIVVNHSPYVR